MITLTAKTLTWLNTADDCPSDLCAHGKVHFVIDGFEFVAPTEEWTLSAAAIYLLRTLERDHIPGDGPLFPCCGFSMFEIEDSDDVLIIGCPNGIDVSVKHQNGRVVITSESGESKSVSEIAWMDAVLKFSDEVRNFYESSAEKTPGDDEDQKGFDKMFEEWERRHPRNPTVG